MGGARGLGAAMGTMAQPFHAGSYSMPQDGQLFGSVGNSGFARAAFMGAGITDLGRQSAYANSAEMQRLASERAGYKFGEIGLGAMGGLAGVGTGLLGGGIGAKFGAMAGGAMFGGAGRMAGGLLGGTMLGGPVGAALMAPVNQMMDQAAYIRGTGEMYGRNAFRMNAAGAGDRTSFRERSRFGQSMMNEGHSDLSFSGQDMQEIFSGAIENDLMRGVGNSQQARQKMRQLKDSVKLIGQTLGTTIRESMSVISEMQSQGLSVPGATGAIAMAGASGLTRNEALSGQMAFSSKYQGSGIQGQGLMNLGGMSQQAGQVAMRQGLLSPEYIAAAGGRQGVNQVYGQGMMSMMGGSLGRLNMAARMGAGGFGGVSSNGLGALGQAGGAATSTNILNFAANGGENMRDMLNDPMAQLRMVQQLGSVAGQFKGLGSDKDIMKLLLKGQGVENTSAFMKILSSQPDAMREQLVGQGRSLNDMQRNQVNENFSISGRIGRFASRATAGVAGDLADSVAGTQDRVVNTITSARNSFFGIEEAYAGKDSVNMESLRSLDDSGMSEDRVRVSKETPTDGERKKAKMKVRKAAALLGPGSVIGGYIQDLKEAKDPAEKKKLAEKILMRLSSGEAAKSPSLQKAYEQAISEQYGVSLSSALNGQAGGLTSSEKSTLSEAKGDLRKMMDVGSEYNGAIGASSGASLGLGVGILLGPMGMLVGAAAGGMFGKKAGEQGGAGFSEETIMKMSQSDNVKSYFKAVGDGDIDKANEAFDRMITDDGFESKDLDAIQQIARSGGAGQALNSMGTVSKLGNKAITRTALEQSSGAAALSLRQAGAGDIADMMGRGDMSGINDALSALNGLDSSKRSEILGSMGAMGSVIGQASEITAGKTRDQLIALGVSGAQADAALSGGSSLTSMQAKELQALVIASSSGGTGLMNTSGKGFTGQQQQLQLEMVQQMAKTTENLRQFAEIVSSIPGIQINKTGR